MPNADLPLGRGRAASHWITRSPVPAMPDSLPDPSRSTQLRDEVSAAERILILDFGSQLTQLIARRLRESGILL